MPELPEVQAVINALQPDIAGREIRGFKLNWRKTLQKPSLKEFESKIISQRITACRRYGKWIILQIESGNILVHLRMSGKLYFSQNLPVEQKYIRARFQLQNGWLIFEDVRKFGRIVFTDSFNPTEFNLGTDFLDPHLQPDYLKHKFTSSRRSIKALLLHQKFIAGLGNIYVDEILWTSHIHPEFNGNQLSVTQLAEILANGRKIITAAIKSRGTSIRSFEVKSGEPGGFQKYLRVYGRVGKNCFRCGQKICKIRVAGRGTYFCHACQKK